MQQKSVVGFDPRDTPQRQLTDHWSDSNFIPIESKKFEL